ncbi:MAG: hypothetical protein HY928_01715 [Elusimicrobia bacterium]|nr:hypothetical protein [Elusimicrobiota bacterium]
MLTILSLSALFAASALPARAADPQVKAYATLLGAAGRKSLPALERSGLIVTADNPDRLLAVSWPLLERAEKYAPRLVEFFAAFDQLRKGREPADPSDSFAELLALPEGGLWSAPLRDALAAAARRAEAARALGERRGLLAKTGSLFRTPWGRELARRTHADLGGAAADAGALDLFRRALAAPGAAPDAAAHLKAWAAASGAADLEPALSASLGAGQPNDDLKALLGRYLRDQAVLEQAEAARDRLSRADRAAAAKAPLEDARTAAAALSAAAGLTAQVREVLAESEPPSSLRLSAHEVHVRGAGDPPLEPGDKAVFSAAYWVDGLPQGRSVNVAEVLVLEDPVRGLSVVSRAAHSRSNGGPFTVSVEAELPRSGSLSYRLTLHAEGAAPVELAQTVEVSDSLDRLQRASAEAQWLGLSCRFEDAERAWKAVLEQAGASSKKAPVQLAADARAALRTVAGWKDRKKELDESLDGARLFATKERCEYRTDRAERALKLLASLPAGCDQAGVGAELADLAAITESRRSLQESFRAGVARAKDREASCKSEEAAALYASVLALLDSDPEARCGEIEREHAAIRLSDLPRAAAAKGLSDAVEAELSNARRRLAEGNPRAALRALQPLSTALRSLSDQRCWNSALSKADELAAASGVALGPLGAAVSLPADPAGPAMAEARHDWDERQAQLNVERGAADSVQAPRSAGEEQ